MGKRLDLTGQKFGRLTAIKLSDIVKYGISYWLCKCDCGNEKIINSASLKNGNTKSCGCLRKKLPTREAACNAVLLAHKYQAKKRNLEQSLTDKQIKIIHKKNCYYCGVSPSNIYSPSDRNSLYVYSGLDRVNNTKGYTIDNVVSCCAICNSAKGEMSYKEFLNW